MRWVILLAALCLLVAGCSGNNPTEVADPDRPDVVELTAPTTIARTVQVSAAEQKLADEMMAEAMIDDVVTADELRKLALEAVKCTRRLGFESELVDFDPVTGEAHFSVAAESQFDERGDRAADACQSAFYVPAFRLFAQ